MRILFLANNDHGLYAFRKELLRQLCEFNEVFVCVPTGKYIPDLIDIGCKHIDIKIQRHGKNPIEDFKLFNNYKAILKKTKPNIVLSYTIKPNIYGGMACQKLNIPYITNVTGLGIGIENKGVIQKLIMFLYKKGLKKAKCVFFQNQSNLDYMVKNKVVNLSISKLLPGSGVNLDENPFENYPQDETTIHFVTIGRIMKEKGTDELLSAIRILKKKHNNLHFSIVGRMDGDYEAIIKEAVSENLIEYLGYRDDIHQILKMCHATIHPSYHEGTSNVLLETAACGRPVIATDVPGCINTFDDGVSGISFKAKDIESLVAAVDKFLLLRNDQKAEMGKAGRKKMENEFNRKIVIDLYMDEIKSIGEN